MKKGIDDPGNVLAEAIAGVAAAHPDLRVDPVNRVTAVLFTQYFPFGKVPLHKLFRDAVYGVPSSPADKVHP